MRRATATALIFVGLGASRAFGGPSDVARMERAIDLCVSNQQFMGAVLVAKDERLLINRG